MLKSSLNPTVFFFNFFFFCKMGKKLIHLKYIWIFWKHFRLKNYLFGDAVCQSQENSFDEIILQDRKLLIRFQESLKMMFKKSLYVTNAWKSL